MIGFDIYIYNLIADSDENPFLSFLVSVAITENDKQ